VLSNRYWFASGTTDDGDIAESMKAAKQARTLVLRRSTSVFRFGPPGQGSCVALQSHHRYVASIGFAVPNYTAQCLAAKDAGVTVLNIADAASVVEDVASVCAAQGFEPTVASGDGTITGTFLTTLS
jgi:hypothetical protein